MKDDRSITGLGDGVMPRGHRCVERRAPARGFTLIEISVALLLAALLMAVAVPSAQSVAATQLRRSASQIAGFSREAYARAAISGKPHRVVFDLDANTFWMESASGFFVLRNEKAKQLSEAELKQKQEQPEEPKFGRLLARSEADLDESERLKYQIARGPQWSAVDDELGQPQPLPADCAFEKVWVAHQAEGFVRGQSMLHFWPSGHTESAIVRLTDDPENNSRVISVKINGLTGRAAIILSAVEVPSS